MSKVFTLFALNLTLLVSTQVFAVCMTVEDAEFEGCLPTESKSADKWCSDKYGSEYKAYYTTDICSKEVSYSYRGETYTSTSTDEKKVVEASCMYYEDGVKNNCELYNYEPADKYCLDQFGGKYLAYIPTNSCSTQKAAKLRGEINSEVLIKGLASSIEEAEALMTMLDKQGINTSLGGGFYHKELEVNYEFYTNTVLTLLAKMKGIKNTLLDNSQGNIKITGKYVPHYLQYAFKYLGILSRVHKLYAYVAHKNHNVLKTYKFDHFKELNLKLKKKFGLEILARVNYKVLTVDNGENLEFEIGEQDKQTLEYMAIEKPKTKVEYGKLVQYLGVREVLTNHWAVQRLTQTKIANPPVRHCGKGFLSFRPGKNGSMTNSSAMEDLWSYDAFYNSYTKHWDKLVDSSREISILSDSEASQLNYALMTNVASLKHYLMNEMFNSLSSDEEFKARAKADAELRILAEDYAWNSFSNDHFSTIVMPSDGVLSKVKIAQRISEDAYRIRVQGIIDNIQGTFPYVSKSGLIEIKSYIEKYMDQNHKSSYRQRLEYKLVNTLKNYNKKSIVRTRNRKEKLDATVEVVKKASQAAHIQKTIDDNKKLDGKILLDPENVEELMMFFERKLADNFDVQFALENNKEFAKVLSEFFRGIAQEFNEKYLVKENGKYKYQGTENERSKALRVISKVHAKAFYDKYPFNIRGHILSQYRNRYVYRDDVDRSGYMPVYEDGTVAPLRRDIIERAVEYERPLVAPVARDNTRVARRYIRPDLNPLLTGNTPAQRDTSNSGSRIYPGWNRDRLTSGEVSIPTYIAESGDIVSPKGVVGKVNNELLRLVKNANVMNAQSVEELEKKPEMLNHKKVKKIKEEHRIKTKSKFAYRVLAILNLDMVAYSSGRTIDRFAHTRQDQRMLAVNKTSQAYQMAPILRNDYTWTETYTAYRGSYGMYSSGTPYEATRTKRMPLLTKISFDAYNAKTGSLDTSKARAMIDKVINTSIDNAGNKLHKFCSSNYLNYKEDENFRDIYKSSGFLRATIKNPMGMTEIEAKKLEAMDKEIEKDIRSWGEAVNEDYLEPTLKVLGYAALVALAVVLIIGSGGAATPGVVGGFYAAASLFLSAEFFISFPLVVGSLYSRVNTHFVEMPEQLKFQRSLAQSQVDFSQVVDWDMLRSKEAELKSKQAWTIGLSSLDFIYAGALIKHVRTATGVAGRGAYRRLTGAKLRGWGAPPVGTFKVERFRDLRTRMSAPKAFFEQVRQVTRRIRAYQPRYQALDTNLLHGTALRKGLGKAAKEIGAHSKPWIFLDEIGKYNKNLRSRLKEYSHFVDAERGIIKEIRLNGGVGLREVLDHGLQYSKFAFIPKSYYQAVKQGKLLQYLKKHGELWNELKFLQGQMVKNRADKIAKVMDKMLDFKRGIQSGTITREGDNLFDQMMKHLSDEEVLVLKEIARKSRGKMKSFKSVFKDYDRVVEGLRPMSYLYGNAGASFVNAAYPQNIIMGDLVDNQYSFKSDADDLINYYESMMRKNGVRSDQMDDARRSAEELISRKMRVTNGNRELLD